MGGIRKQAAIGRELLGKKIRVITNELTGCKIRKSFTRMHKQRVGQSVVHYRVHKLSARAWLEVLQKSGVLTATKSLHRKYRLFE